MKIAVRTSGFPETHAVLKRSLRAVRDLSPVWPEFEVNFFKIEQKAFRSSGHSQGKQWRGLSYRYQQWKKKHYPGRKILHLTGRLESSLTEFAAVDQILRRGRTRMQIFSTVPYGRYHQEGTGKMPQRTPVNLTNRDVASFAVIVHRHFMRDVFKGLPGPGSRVSAAQALRGF